MTEESSVQFSLVAQLCLTLGDQMDCNTLDFPVHHQLPELAQTVSIESVMPSNHLSLLNQVAKVLELQLQHLSFQ